MKQLLKTISFATIILIFITSCDKEDFKEGDFKDHDFIKSEVSNDNITSIYKYNAKGKIAETEGVYYYNKYVYDNDGLLISIETAVNPSLLSSSFSVDKTELMTEENSTISNRQIFKYDESGRLIEIENYTKTEGKFVLRSKQSFEFNFGKIVKSKLHNEDGEITQFTVYGYDQNGNVVNEKYYSQLFTESAQAILISEASYKFDNKNNPFKIFNALGQPALYTNSNNIIETNLIRHEEVPGFEKYSNSITSYEYNRNNYPIRVVTENGEYDYRY
jgi:hypothetical protein